MPVDLNGVGYGEYSPAKQADLHGLLTQHGYIAKGIFSKPYERDNSYVYIDANAGPGYVPKYRLRGSPLIALDRISNALDNAQWHFCERVPANMDQLCDRLRDNPFWTRIHAWQGSNQVLTPRILDTLGMKDVGLLYHDPTESVDWGLLRTAAAHPKAKRIDLLVYFSAANHKRAGIEIAEELRQINKEHWIIRDLQGKHQFSFLLGTNWNSYPSWKNRGFYPINEARGQYLLDVASWSTKQRHDRDNGQFDFGDYDATGD